MIAYSITTVVSESTTRDRPITNRQQRWTQTDRLAFSNLTGHTGRTRKGTDSNSLSTNNFNTRNCVQTSATRDTANRIEILNMFHTLSSPLVSLSPQFHSFSMYPHLLLCTSACGPIFHSYNSISVKFIWRTAECVHCELLRLQRYV